MGEVRVYRIQDREGRGPFKPGFSRFWADEEFADGVLGLPTILQDFGADLITRLGRDGEHFGTAVRTPQELQKWFSNTEMAKLADLGYNPVSLRIDRVLAESSSQLVFAKSAPLTSGAVMIDWPFRVYA